MSQFPSLEKRAELHLWTGPKRGEKINGPRVTCNVCGRKSVRTLIGNKNGAPGARYIYNPHLLLKKHIMPLFRQNDVQCSQNSWVPESHGG